MNTAFLLTGGNLGNRMQNLETAANLIEKNCGNIYRSSSVYETAAWGYADQPDFLLVDGLVYNSASVTIPHPRLAERRFVLTPLAEIAGEIMHPVLHKTINELLLECKDELPVHKISLNQ